MYVHLHEHKVIKLLCIQLQRQHVFSIKICVCEALRSNLRAKIYLHSQAFLF